MSAHSAEGGRTDSTAARGMQQVGEHGSGIARDIIGLHEALPGEILEQGVLLRLHLHSLIRYAVTCRVAFRHAVASAAMEAGVVPPLPPAATVFNWLHFARCTRGIQRSALALSKKAAPSLSTRQAVVAWTTISSGIMMRSTHICTSAFRAAGHVGTDRGAEFAKMLSGGHRLLLLAID